MDLIINLTYNKIKTFLYKFTATYYFVNIAHKIM